MPSGSVFDPVGHQPVVAIPRQAIDGLVAADALHVEAVGAEFLHHEQRLGAGLCPRRGTARPRSSRQRRGRRAWTLRQLDSKEDGLIDASLESDLLFKEAKCMPLAAVHGVASAPCLSQLLARKSTSARTLAEGRGPPGKTACTSTGSIL